MDVPDWADRELSEQLPALRARGEGQDLEYKECFPQQATHLGKEIAALATSNGGTILLGVSDDGDLVGMPDAHLPDKRDALVRRVEGISHGTVKPAITPSIKWASERGKHVMVIGVPKGTDPVYFCGDVPYLRHISSSRAAQPNEIINLVREWLKHQDEEELQAMTARMVLYQAASMVTESLIFLEEIDKFRGSMKTMSLPYYTFRSIAARLREIAVEQDAVEQGLSDELERVADAVDRLTHSDMTEMPAAVQNASRILGEFKARHIDPVPLSPSELEQAKCSLSGLARQVRGLVARMGNRRGQIEDIQEEASRHGFRLLELGYSNIDPITEGTAARVRAIGHQLHLVQTLPVHTQERGWMEAITQAVASANTSLQELVAELGL